MLYYRYTHRPSPMSDWGHAMFVDNPYSSAHYGHYCWTLDSKLCTPIDDIRQLIIDTWEHDRANGFIGDFGSNAANDYYYQFAGEEIANSFNPVDIVDSANAWDCELTTWFWERIAEPNNIMAISTHDGAICFDESLINTAAKEVA